MSGYSVVLRHLKKVFEAGDEMKKDLAAVNDVSLEINSGEFFTLLGPSGCGKTTILRCIGGFEKPTQGEIIIQGQPMEKIPPHRRPVNTVFQNYALFPHMTVKENIAFGLNFKKVPAEERRRRVSQVLELVRLPDIGDRKPEHLSGGQQQRVALARALVNEPSVLLLDEPLGALDLHLRKQMQFELKHIQQQVGITFIYVTHDQEEALTMSDRIAVMSEGNVLQVGDPVTIYEKPECRFVANFIGETNFLSGIVIEKHNTKLQICVADAQVFSSYQKGEIKQGQPITLTIRPEKLTLTKPGLAEESCLPGIIQEVIYLGTDTRFVVLLRSGETIVARIQNIARQGLGEFQIGDEVEVGWVSDDARALLG